MSKLFRLILVEKIAPIVTLISSFLCGHFSYANNNQLLPSENVLQKVANSKAWLQLLHYESKVTGGHQSRIVNPEFFFHADGADNPLDELRSTVQVMLEDMAGVSKPVGSSASTPLCAFPARRKFLSEELQIEMSSKECKEFEEWKIGIGAKSVSLVFSSSYSGSPGSLFGHTFLKFNRHDLPLDGQETINHLASKELNDYSLSFAANTGDSNPFKYFLYGIFGGFSGIFALDPFYLKVREYNNAEGRDLWIYDLNLNAKEVDQLVAHTWELMRFAAFDYYFFTENCASILLKIIEVAKPKLSYLTGPRFAVLPMDTIREVDSSKETIAFVRSRGSLKTELDARLADLSLEQRFEFEKILKNPIELTAIKNEDPKYFEISRSKILPAPKVLLTIVTFIEWSRLKNKGEISEALVSLKKDVLILLSKNASVKSDKNFNLAIENPAEGHSPAQVWIGAQSVQKQNKQSFEKGILFFGARYGYHGLMDPSYGFEKGLGIEYLWIKLDYNFHRHKAQRLEFKPLEVRSLNDFSLLNRQLSYAAKFNSQVSFFENPKHVVSATFGVGLAQKTKNAIAYGLLVPEFIARSSKKSANGSNLKVLPDLGVELGLYADLSKVGRINLATETKIRMGQSTRVELQLSRRSRGKHNQSFYVRGETTTEWSGITATQVSSGVRVYF